MTDEATQALKDIRAYVRLQAASSVTDLAKKVIDFKEKAAVYEMLDGKKTHLKISQLVGVPRKTVTNWIGEFTNAGLAMNERGSGDKALFGLEELGITVNKLKKRSSKSSR